MRSLRMLLRKSILIAIILSGILSACNADNGAETETSSTRTPTSQPATNEILIVTGEFPPQTGEALPGGGYVTAIVRAVFAEMGYSVRIEFYPWGRAEAMVESGEAWGTYPYVINEERREKYLISEPIIYNSEVFFYYGDAMENVTYTEFSDLAPYRIGGATGYWYVPVFEEAGLNVEIATDDLDNLNKLKAGRIDLYPLNEVVGLWLIQTHFPEDADQFGRLERPSYVGDSRMMISHAYPNSEALMQEFNAALAAIQADGTYAAIYEEYGIPLNIPEITPATNSN